MAQTITITSFTGEEENPHVGAGVAVGVDLYTTKTVARLSRKMNNVTGSLITSFPLYVTQGNAIIDIPAELTYTQIIPTPSFIAGEVITGLASGATATITSVALGVMILSSVSGTFSIGEIIKGGTSNGEGHVDTFAPAVTSELQPLIFVQDEDGNIYQSMDNAVTWTQIITSATPGKGIMIWQNYLFFASPTDISIYGPLGNSPTLTVDWWTTVALQTALVNEVDVNHVMFIKPSNGVMYICNGNKIGYLQYITGAPFDPTMPGISFLASDSQFIMPDFYNAVTIGFLPIQSLAIGVKNNLNDSKADIVIWDGINNNLAQNVITVPGATGAVTQLLTNNGVLYGVTNFEHGVYVINGSSAQKVERLALRMSNRFTTGEQFTTRVASTIYPHGADFLGPELLTGASNFPQAVTEIAGTGMFPYGVWSVNIENFQYSVGTPADYVTGVRFPLSHGVINAQYTTDYSIGFVKVLTTAKVIVGWKAGNTFGIDALDAQNYISNPDTTFVESSLYEVGTRSQPAVFDLLEYNLVTPLRAGESITWYWRKNLANPYQQFHVEDFTTLGTNTSDIITPLPFDKCQYIQIAFKFNSSTTVTSNLTPQIRSMILRIQSNEQ